MYKNQIYEISMVLDSEAFKNIMKEACTEKLLIADVENEYIDASLTGKGIIIKYRDSPYKKKIKIIINSGIQGNYKEITSEKLVRKINKRIENYFNGKYQLDDFTLSTVILIHDINVKSREMLSAYLKVFHRINKVKAFSKEMYGLDKNRCFRLNGNSNGVGFYIYDLESILKTQGIDVCKRDGAEGILRVEVELSKLKTIRNYVDGISTSKAIKEINDKYMNIFLDVFKQVIPYGEFYKKDEAVDIIHRNVKDKVLKRKMLRLVALIPEKKSLFLAQKAMKCREMDKVMDGFVKINLSPVTISKRQETKYLKNLYAYLGS